MARLARLVVAGQTHLVLLLALPDAHPFADTEDRDGFLAALRAAAEAEPVQLHAWALLPNEARLMVTPQAADALGRFMQGLGRRYVSAYNRRHGRAGTLWAGRFRACVVEPGASRWVALLYVDAAAALGESTSAGGRSGGQRLIPLADPPECWALGNTPFERESAYRAAVERGLDEATAHRLRQAALGGWVYGSPAFVAALGSQIARPLRPRARGRPTQQR